MLSRLKQIKVEYFQSHESTVLDLHEGVNTIVGTSTTGKSALARAIRWLALNKPAGLAFMSNFAPRGASVKVTATTEDGEVISAERSRSAGHVYRAAGQRFTGVGRSVPDQVVEQLGVHDINMQTQLEPHYLITASPGEFARAIDTVTNTEKIDKAVAKISARIKKNKTKINEHSERIVEKNEMLSEFEDFSDLEVFLTKARKAQIEVTRAATKRRRLIDIKTELSDLRRDEVKPETIRIIRRSIEYADRYHVKMNHAMAKLDIIDDFSDTDSRLRVLLKQHRMVSTGIRIAQQCQSVIDDRKAIQKVIDRYEQAEAKLEEVITEKNHTAQLLEEIMDDLDECPLCGSTL